MSEQVAESTEADDRTKLYSLEEAAELTGVSTKALNGRMDRGALTYVLHTPRTGGRPRRVIPRYALDAAGLLTPGETRRERSIRRLIAHLRRHPEEPFSTVALARLSSMPRQACDSVMLTLLALGHVRRTYEPSTDGAGGLRVVWRWRSAA